MRVNPNRMEQSEADPPLAPSWGWNGRMTLGYIRVPIPRHEWPVWAYRLITLGVQVWTLVYLWHVHDAVYATKKE